MSVLVEKIKSSNTARRVVVGGALVLAAAVIAVAQYYGLPAVRIASVVVVAAMIVEFVLVMLRAGWATLGRNAVVCGGFMAWLILMLCAANVVGTRPWIMLLLLMTISCADIGAWLFGGLFGGDKMWERLSAHKTWSGQIAGIVCGTVASILYGMLGTDTFMPQLMWIGISVSLLSQYGDLTASWIKRRLGIKDFGNLLPGHGGVIDRFDGWIYALVLVWLIML